MPRLARPSLDWLLVFLPISLVLDLAGQTTAVFVTSALAMVPLAGLIGKATEQVAGRLGPRLGGLLNATLGNLTELIVGVLLIAAGDFAIVKASLIGSMVGNLLLVLGLSFAAGGVRHVEQRFNPRAVGVHTTSLVLAVAGLVMPALVIPSTPRIGFAGKEVLSAIVAGVLIALYLAAVAYTELTHAHLFHVHGEAEKATWSARRAVIVLAAAALLVGLESELLVSSLKRAMKVLPIPQPFVCLI